ncbi:hypothetical protein SODALDRAFT_354226 [Sodiomyces alkalinus F11]|uniref:Uncharacterized protein n=1 Tax=Sodiomyces alkalinus (strain CBS 110278 / VKM F-3762 / F11) TaxID=1314773 RepID=A0A3N2Q5Y5_SODAK|nr:hypothetical protein SODALDRAFT_354226 [Sodiomyces alkalinus F11]ROT42107.1 hypothetical protein SODALDRAFT_354226 [Sodiomyces alkalinus F11]
MCPAGPTPGSSAFLLLLICIIKLGTWKNNRQPTGGPSLSGKAARQCALLSTIGATGVRRLDPLHKQKALSSVDECHPQIAASPAFTTGYDDVLAVTSQMDALLLMSSRRPLAMLTYVGLLKELHVFSGRPDLLTVLESQDE